MNRDLEMQKEIRYDIKLNSGEIIKDFSRREMMELATTEGYRDAIVKPVSENENWISIQEWKSAIYSEMKAKNHFVIVGEPLSWWEKFLSLTFLYPKRWQLLRFELVNDTFTLSFGDNQMVSFSKGSFEAIIDIDKHQRRKISIRLTNGRKYAFFESLTGIASEDFKLILQLLDAKESGMMRFSLSMMNINRQLSRLAKR